MDNLKAKATEFMKNENVDAMKAEAAEKLDDLKALNFFLSCIFPYPYRTHTYIWTKQ